MSAPLDVPYETAIDLSTVKKVVIKGKPPKDVKSFNFNFQTGTGPAVNFVAFQFDVRFMPTHYIAMNYKKDGKWGREIPVHGFPFSEDQDFTTEILVFFKGYTVIVDGREIAEFPNELPMKSVDTFTIYGDLQLAEATVV